MVGVAGGDLAAGQADLPAEVGGQRGGPGIGNRRGSRDRGALGQVGRYVADAELDGGVVRGGSSAASHDHLPRRVGDPERHGSVSGRPLCADIKRGKPVISIRARRSR